MVREPFIRRSTSLEIRCAANGPEVETEAYNTSFSVTLKDLEDFCHAARTQGVPDDAVVQNVYGDGERGAEQVAARIVLNAI